MKNKSNPTNIFNKAIRWLVLLVLFCNCKTNQSLVIDPNEVFLIDQLTDHVYRYVTYLETEKFGMIPCNGMIVVDQGEVILIDIPPNPSVTKKLNAWIESELGATVVAVIPTHFHIDCLGGLQVYHDMGIPSYAFEKTIELSNNGDNTRPQNSFGVHKVFNVGKLIVTTFFPGEGHTSDNIVVYVDKENVLFGGCLIKSLNASKGNLEDASPDRWSTSVAKVKSDYPDVKYIIPGHGEVAGPELLEYTIQLFLELNLSDLLRKNPGEQ